MIASSKTEMLFSIQVFKVSNLFASRGGQLVKLRENQDRIDFIQLWAKISFIVHAFVKNV